MTNFYDPNKELNEAREFKQKSAITKLGSHLAKKISDMSHRGMSNRNRTFQESLSSSKGTNYVELKRRGVWVIQRIAPNVSSVTFVTNLVDEGIIPGEWCFHFAFPPLFLEGTGLCAGWERSRSRSHRDPPAAFKFGGM